MFSSYKKIQFRLFNTVCEKLRNLLKAALKVKLIVVLPSQADCLTKNVTGDNLKMISFMAQARKSIAKGTLEYNPLQSPDPPFRHQTLALDARLSDLCPFIVIVPKSISFVLDIPSLFATF